MKYLIVLILLTGCGRSVFDRWESETGSSYDLSAVRWFGGSFQIEYVFESGTICEADATLIGSDASGALIITNSTLAGGLPIDPCYRINGSYSYSLQDSLLEICKKQLGSGCDTFRATPSI